MLIVSLLVFLWHGVSCQKNNVCKTFIDYKTIANNSNCWYNYMMDHDIGDVVQYYGYPFEEYDLITKDGYILKLHRLPNTNHPNPKKSVIYMHHGFASNSYSWFGLLKDSLPFMLADEGYDIWLPNIRGNIYSSKHVKWNVNMDEFWKYSLDEVATIDTPLNLNFVAERTGAAGDIIYIGHSMGTSVGTMYASEFHNEAANLLKFMILMGPAYSVANTKTLFRPLASMADTILRFLDNFHLLKMVSNGKISSMLMKNYCENMLKGCFDLANSFVLGPKTGLQPEIVPIAFLVLGQGGSLRMLKQTVDTITKYPAMRKYDFGSVQNRLLYGSREPPIYDLKNFKIPVHIMASESDMLCAIADAKKFYLALPPTSQHGFYSVPSKNFNHVDYIGGIEAKKLVNDYVINLIKKFD